MLKIRAKSESVVSELNASRHWMGQLQNATAQRNARLMATPEVHDPCVARMAKIIRTCANSKKLLAEK